MDWLLEQALTGLTPKLGTPEQRILQSIGEPGNRIRLSPRGVQIAYPDLSGGGEGRLANPLNRFLSSAQYRSKKQTGWEEFLAPGKQGRNFIAANNATLDSYLAANPQYQGLFNPGTPQYQDFQRRLYGAMSTGAAIRNLAEVTGAPFSQPLGVRPFLDSSNSSPFSAERQLYLRGGGDIFQNPQNYFKHTQITPAQNGEYRITRRDGREIFFNPVFGYVRQGGNYTRTLSPEGMGLLQSFGIQPGQTIQDFAKALNEGGTISTRDIGDLARQGDAFTLAPLTQMQLAAARQQFNADLDQEGAQFIDGQRLFNTSNVNLYRGKEALRPMAEAIVRLAEKRRRAEPGRNLLPLTEDQAFQVAAQLVHSTYGLEDGIPAQNRIKSLKGLSRVSHNLFEPLQDYGNELQFTNAVLQEMKAPSIHPRTLGQIASSQMQPALADRPGPLIDYEELKQTGELSPGDVGRLRTEVTRVINTMNPVAPNSAYSDRHSPLIGREESLGPATVRNLTNQGAGTLSSALEQLFPETFSRSTDSRLERMLGALRVAPNPKFIPTVNYWGNPFTYRTGGEVGDPVVSILGSEPAALSDYHRLGIQEVDAITEFNDSEAALARLYQADPYAAVQEGAGGAGDIYDLMGMREQQALAEASLQDPYDPTSRVPRNAIGFDAAYLDPRQINPVLTTRQQGGQFIKNKLGQNIGYEGGRIIEGPHTPLPAWMINDSVTGTVAGRQALFNPTNHPSLFNDPGLIADFTDYRNFFNSQRSSSRLGSAVFTPNYWEPPSSRSIRQMQDDWFNAPQQWEDRSDDVADPKYLGWSDDIDRQVLADRELAAQLQANNDQMFAEAQRERAFYEAQNANPRLLYNPSFQQLAQSNPEMAIAALERAWPGGSHLVGINPKYDENEAARAARSLTVGDYGIQNMPGGLNLTDQEKLLAMRDGSDLQNLIDDPYFGLPPGQEAITQSRFETEKGGSVDLSKKPRLISQLQNRIVNTPGGTIPWLISNELPKANQSEFQELGSTRVAMPKNNDIFVRFSQIPAVESVYSTESNRLFLSPQELLNQAWPLQQLRPDEAYYQSLQPENPGILGPWQAKNLRKQELRAISAATQAGIQPPFRQTQEPLVLTRLLSNQAPTIVDPQQFTVSTPNTLRVPAPPPSLGIPYAQRQPWAGGPTGLTEIRGAGTPPDLLTPQAQAYPLSPGAQARATLGNTNFSRFDTYNVDPSDPRKVIEDYQSRLNAIMGTGEAQRELMVPQQNQQNAPVIQAPRKIITQPATGQVVQSPTNVWAGSGDNAQAPAIVAPTQAIQYASPIQYPSLGRKAYAGIGSRTTPLDVQQLMTRLAGALEDQGYVLRSGGAQGADLAFEAGVRNPANKEIWLIPDEFAKRQDATGAYNFRNAPGYQSAMDSVAQFALPDRIPRKTVTKELFARSAMQVLGADLQNPSRLIYAWTPGGLGGGGTGQALRIAQPYGVPIRDLGNPVVRQEVEKRLGIARPVNLPLAATTPSQQVTQYATPKNPRQIQLPMNYEYQGMARPEVTQYLQQTGRPLTTMGAVDAGLRTGTTRSSLPPGLAVGDLISITGGGLPAVQAQVDAILNQGEFNPATRAWSIREGWQSSPGGKIGEQVFSPNAKQVIWTPVDRPTIVRGINSPVDYAKAQVYGNQNIALGFTANSMRNQSGALVMGAGNAQQAALANPSAPIRFGVALRDQGIPLGGDYGLVEDPSSNFVAIQTKRDWRQPTPMDLLENVTLPAVQQWSRNNPGRLLITPPWGIGQGGANPDQVAELMSRLPANVMIADPRNTPAFRRNSRFLFI